MPADNLFAFNHPGLTGSIIGTLGLITPDDNNELTYLTRQISFEGAGDVSVVFQDGSTAVIPVAAGDVKEWRIRKVNLTGTTATGIRGYY